MTRQAEQKAMPFREPTTRERDLSALLARIDGQLAANPQPAPERAR